MVYARILHQGRLTNILTGHVEVQHVNAQGQYNAGFATRLLIKEGSNPSIRDGKTAIKSPTAMVVRHVGCQTAPTETTSVGTQLSKRTLQHHFRSKGVQVKVCCSDFGVGASAAPFDTLQPTLTSAPFSGLLKRPRLEYSEYEEEDFKAEEYEVDEFEVREFKVEDSEVDESEVREFKEEEDEPKAEEDPGEGASSIAAPQPHDDAYDPEDSHSGLAQSTDVLEVPPPSQYIVYETCLLELFEVCPMCQWACDVRCRRLGGFLTVHQLCRRCRFSRHWGSQPATGGSPDGNLQPATGGSPDGNL
ncbi:hypothetical protein GJAV_G00214190 [Gymnothorax javanicus]|nr:hypothetical protein GJAV_G00214190 [Gymnothorax javanicus]